MKTRDDGYTLDTLPTALRSLDKWPAFDATGLATDEAARFNRRMLGIQQLLDGARLKDAAATAVCSGPELSRLLARCLTYSASRSIVGLQALQKNFHFGRYMRTSELGSNSRAGMFTRLLEQHVSLKRSLDGLITSRTGTLGKLSRKHKTQVVRDFLAHCAALGLKEHQYPFDSESDSKRTVYRYIDNYLDRNFAEYDIWFGHNATLKLKVGRGDASFSAASRPFDLVHVDAYRVDVIGSICVETEHGPKLIAIQRLWLVVVFDSFSGAVLGYSISYEDQVSAETVERALLSSQRQWRPRRLCEDLEYVPGAGLPAGIIAGINRCPIVTLCADNFSSHYAKVIQVGARRAIGMHVCYGPIGSFFHNAPLERFFGVLADHGIKRLISTVGSGPSDPMRPIAPVKASVKNSVTWRFIEDLLEVELTGENTRRGTGRSDMSPIEIISNHLESSSVAFLVRPRPNPHPLGERLGYEVHLGKIKGNQAKGQLRRPYIEFFGRRYRHAAFESDFSTIGQPVRLHVRREDCEIEAFFADGRPIGILVLSRTTARRPIPLSMLKSIYNRSKNSLDYPEVWEIERVRKEHQDGAVEDLAQRPHAVSRHATKLAALDSSLAHAQHVSDAAQVSASPKGESRVDDQPAKNPDAPSTENDELVQPTSATPDVATGASEREAPVSLRSFRPKVVSFGKIRRG